MDEQLIEKQPKEPKQPYINLDCREKALLTEIIREADGGKVIKILAQGPSSNQLKADIWKRVQQIFFIETGRDVPVEKLRKCYSRLKTKGKKTHDDKVQKKFAQSCSTTGGGVGPSPPAEPDGDDFDEEMSEAGLGVILDPTPTPFNTLTKSKRVRVLMPRQEVEEQEIISGCSQPSPPLLTPSRRENTSSPTPATLSQSGPGRPRPFLSQINASPSLDWRNDAFDLSRRSASPTLFSSRPRSSSGVESPATPRGSPAVSSARPRSSASHEVTEEIVITNTSTGETRTVPPEFRIQDSNNNSKAKKGKAANKKDVINAGAEYYTEMLVKQTDLMKMRKKLLKIKQKNEKFKQVLLRKQISDLGIEVEQSSESSSSDSEDFDDDDD